MIRHKAGPYNYIDDLWILTSYFNPQRYRSKQRNYQIFLDKLDRGQAPIIDFRSVRSNYRYFPVHQKIRIYEITGLP